MGGSYEKVENNNTDGTDSVDDGVHSDSDPSGQSFLLPADESRHGGGAVVIPEGDRTGIVGRGTAADQPDQRDDAAAHRDLRLLGYVQALRRENTQRKAGDGEKPAGDYAQHRILGVLSCGDLLYRHGWQCVQQSEFHSCQRPARQCGRRGERGSL